MQLRGSSRHQIFSIFESLSTSLFSHLSLWRTWKTVLLIYGVQWKVRYLITSLQTDSPVTIAGLIMHSQSWTILVLLVTRNDRNGPLES